MTPAEVLRRYQEAVNAQGDAFIARFTRKLTKAEIAYRRSAARDGRLTRTWIDLGNAGEAAYHARHAAHAAFLPRPDLRHTPEPDRESWCDACGRFKCDCLC